LARKRLSWLDNRAAIGARESRMSRTQDRSSRAFVHAI
jgi:hypothetical protein